MESDDHIGGRQRLERLDADVSEASAAADHNRVRSGIEQRDRFLDGMVGGEPRIGQGRHILWLDLGIELDYRPRTGLEKLGKASVGVDPGEGAAAAMHIVARAAMPAEPTRYQRVNDDGVANGDVLDSGADSVHPTRILMPQRVGQFDVAFFLPLAFYDVQIGSAKPGAADAHDYIVRPADLGVGNFFQNRSFAVSVQADCFHAATSSEACTVRSARG